MHLPQEPARYPRSPPNKQGRDLQRVRGIAYLDGLELDYVSPPYMVHLLGRLSHADKMGSTGKSGEEDLPVALGVLALYLVSDASVVSHK